MDSKVMRMADMVDAVVVGGGAAGLNGALMLARSRRSVVVIDAGRPRNAPAEGVHGLFARDGTPPLDLLAAGRDEVDRYGGRVVSGEVVRVSRTDDRFRVELADDASYLARRLLVTSGAVDELPDIPGLRERWGRDVIHCPYCHGWEVRDRAIGVIVTGPRAVHQALMFRQLSPDVVVFGNGESLPEADIEQLVARGIKLVPGTVESVETSDDRLVGVRVSGVGLVRRQALVVASRMAVPARFLAGIGLHAVAHPSGAGEHLPADPFGRSDVPGVWLAGNVTDPMAQVGAAAAGGAMAGAQINADLIAEETRVAVALLREPGESAPGRRGLNSPESDSEPD